MPAAEPALPRPAAARRPFAEEEVLRRIIRLADLERGARVLELGIGDGRGTELLAGPLALDVVAVGQDARTVEAVRERTKDAGLKGNLELKAGTLSGAGLREGSFDLALVLDWDHLGFVDLLRQVRPLLAKGGKLCVTSPVKVGRFPQAQAVESWERRLKAPLGYPRDLMSQMSLNGFEPQWGETLSDSELDAFYAAVADESPEFKDELAVHRAQGGRSGVTFALLLGRRKESGEKPPVSRDRG